MSVLPSQITSSVAPMQQQQQSVARQRQTQEGQPQQEIRRVQELFESHLRALEDADEFESPTHLHVDGDTSQDQSNNPQQERRKQNPATPGEAKAETPPVVPPTPPVNEQTESLYRHLDVQA